MTNIELSTNQISDAVGVFTEAVQMEIGGGAYVPEPNAVPCPDYDLAASYFEVAANTPSFAVTPGDQTLGMLGGLRVIVGVHSKDHRFVQLPGIVLPDSGSGGIRIGCLSGPDIIRDDTLPLTDLQQVLLEQVAAMHMPGVGEHAKNQQVNIGDIGHAALVAITAPEAAPTIHSEVHTFVGAGLSQTIARTGALTIGHGHTARNVQEIIIPFAQAAQVMVPRHYQLPSRLDLQAGDLAVGITLAAVRSKGSNYPQPDLARNAAAVIMQRT
jgi:hypothetical protein